MSTQNKLIFIRLSDGRRGVDNMHRVMLIGGCEDARKRAVSKAMNRIRIGNYTTSSSHNSELTSTASKVLYTFGSGVDCDLNIVVGAKESNPHSTVRFWKTYASKMDFEFYYRDLDKLAKRDKKKYVYLLNGYYDSEPVSVNAGPTAKLTLTEMLKLFRIPFCLDSLKALYGSQI